MFMLIVNYSKVVQVCPDKVSPDADSVHGDLKIVSLATEGGGEP